MMIKITRNSLEHECYLLPNSMQVGPDLALQCRWLIFCTENQNKMKKLWQNLFAG